VIPADALAATFEIIVWDNSSGLYPTWVQASLGWQSGQIAAGHSSPFTVTAIGGLTNVAPNLNNSQGSANGMTSFNLRRFGPTVTTLGAVQVGATGAQVWGIVNPNDGHSTAWFEWGTTTNYGSLTSAPFINSDGSFGVGLGSLSPGTTYYFRAVANNSYGQGYGDGASFTTQTLPIISVTTFPATDVTPHSATLNGAVYGTTSQTSAGWEYGTTTNYGSLTPFALVGDGPMPPFCLDGLTPGSTYHFRAQAHNSLTSGYGADQSFTTLMLPTVVTINTGSGCWDCASSTLRYSGDTGGAHSFILLQSVDPTAPPSAWMRIATNASSPGSFSIPPMGTAAAKYYRIKTE
jgi:hypothetical protein